MLKWKGKHYVHAWHDHHVDWRRRAEAPFLVSDRALSLVARPGVPFELIRDVYPSMPHPAHSRYGRGHKLYSVPEPVRGAGELARTTAGRCGLAC